MLRGKNHFSRSIIWQKETAAQGAAEGNREQEAEGVLHLFLQTTGQILLDGQAQLATRQGVAETMRRQRANG